MLIVVNRDMCVRVWRFAIAKAAVFQMDTVNSVFKITIVSIDFHRLENGDRAMVFWGKFLRMTHGILISTHTVDFI